MKKLQFVDIISILQDSFEEDLLIHVDNKGDLIDEPPATENALAGYLMLELYNAFEPESDNETKLESFATVIENARELLDDVERSLDSWEEYVDSSRDKYED